MSVKAKSYLQMMELISSVVKEKRSHKKRSEL